MKHLKMTFAAALVVGLAAVSSCKQQASSENAADSTNVDSTKLVNPDAYDRKSAMSDKDLQPNKELTETAAYYADKAQDRMSAATLTKVDELMKSDMSDLREKCDFVYYPFAGGDFLYPYTMFPDADTYLMIGMELPGSAIKGISDNMISAYSNALISYLSASFFCTNNMRNDLHNNQIDGTIPVITMLMAKKHCKLISVTHKALNDEGELVDADDTSNIAEVQFFREDTPRHRQTLYYFSSNIEDSSFDPALDKFLAKSFKGRNIVTFLKAASYLMHRENFSKIRSNILDNVMALVQDDSGIPVSYFNEGWDNTFYGEYYRPIPLFSSRFQSDLRKIYESGNVRPLDFRIGYSSPSNWMCSRKKK